MGIFDFLKKDKGTSGKVVTRIAPSPTGNLHIGTARSALYNYLFARQTGGTFLIRVEDTDRERSKKEYEENILSGLEWLGLKSDGIVRQSERVEIHSKYLKQMIEDGSAYVSKEEAKEEGQRSEVIRFKNPNKVVTFHDSVRGDISFDTTELGDFVIAKSVEEPLYHLAVVVDDFEMGVTHVIRGDDHISNTPRQILIMEAIGAPRPVYAHMPLILAPDRSKLSKRKGAVSINEYKDRGYLPEALVNYLGLLGFNPGTDQEFYSLEELVKVFNLERLQKGGAVFDQEKLNWFNKHYLEQVPDSVFSEKIVESLPGAASFPERLATVLPIVRERVSTFEEIRKIIDEGELSYYFAKPSFEASLMEWKGNQSKEEIAEHLTHAKTIFSDMGANEWHADTLKDRLWQYATEKGRGNVLWPLRVSLSGKDKSPDPFTLASILGREETLARIDSALALCTTN